MPKGERLVKLNQIAIQQMQVQDGFAANFTRRCVL